MTRARTKDDEDRIKRRMAEIDALPPALRACVHDLGWDLVKNFMDHGVSNPKHIRALVNVVISSLRPPEIEAMRREMETK